MVIVVSLSSNKAQSVATMSAEHYCDRSYFVWLITFLPFSIICFTSTIPVIYRLIILHKTTKSSSKSLFYSGLIFLISTSTIILLMNISGFTRIHECLNKNYISPSSRLYIVLGMNALYVTQFYLLLLVLYTRLKVIFQDTMWKISRNMVRFYTTIFVITPSIFIVAAIIHTILPFTIIDLIGVLLCFVMIIILIISMMVLFIRKLIQIYKNAFLTTETDDSTLWISTITKTTLLTFISILLTLLSPISLAMANVTKSTHAVWVSNFMVLFDVYTNFICVTLSYNHHADHYNKLCGCMDSQCRKMWTKMVTSKSGDEEVISTTMDNDTISINVQTPDESNNRLDE